MASSSVSHVDSVEYNALDPNKSRTGLSRRRLTTKSFDVFINHRGPDVKGTLVSQLYDSLTIKGLRPFLDSEELQHGDMLSATIETAIRSAAVNVAIFSKGYAESAWCLAELELMLEANGKIIPVFYGVKPSDLRHIEKGVYAEAFAKHEENRRYLDKLKGWKKCLEIVSDISGPELSSDGTSYKDVEKIASVVAKDIRRPLLVVTGRPEGLDAIGAPTQVHLGQVDPGQDGDEQVLSKLFGEQGAATQGDSGKGDAIQVDTGQGGHEQGAAIQVNTGQGGHEQAKTNASAKKMVKGVIWSAIIIYLLQNLAILSTVIAGKLSWSKMEPIYEGIDKLERILVLAGCVWANKDLLEFLKNKSRQFLRRKRVRRARAARGNFRRVSA